MDLGVGRRGNAMAMLAAALGPLPTQWSGQDLIHTAKMRTILSCHQSEQKRDGWEHLVQNPTCSPMEEDGWFFLFAFQPIISLVSHVGLRQRTKPNLSVEVNGEFTPKCEPVSSKSHRRKNGRETRSYVSANQ